jgi:hypothetical protein
VVEERRRGGGRRDDKGRRRRRKAQDGRREERLEAAAPTEGAAAWPSRERSERAAISRLSRGHRCGSRLMVENYIRNLERFFFIVILIFLVLKSGLHVKLEIF